LDRIHDGHQGVTESRERANMAVWRPGISRDIPIKVSTSEFCQENLPSQRKEPLVTTPLSERTWKNGADLCEHKGNQFLADVQPLLKEMRKARQLTDSPLTRDMVCKHYQTFNLELLST